MYTLTLKDDVTDQYLNLYHTGHRELITKPPKVSKGGVLKYTHISQLAYSFKTPIADLEFILLRFSPVCEDGIKVDFDFLNQIRNHPLKDTNIVIKDYVNNITVIAEDILKISQMTEILSLSDITEYLKTDRSQLIAGFILRDIKDLLKPWPQYNQEEALVSRMSYKKVY